MTWPDVVAAADRILTTCSTDDGMLTPGGDVLWLGVFNVCVGCITEAESGEDMAFKLGSFWSSNLKLDSYRANRGRLETPQLDAPR